ncbi:alkane hydroxylase MAH1-like [Rutidosis leptorrhynchoides]|uniref:alkane hydroxylase MAH1-like n=1 Tax=Rutidosis leptorrhynchoides TaxID=125765 RepID=UPI003A99E6BD
MENKLMPILDVMSKSGSKMDLQEIFQRLTFDAILILLLGYDPKTLSIDFPYNKFEKGFTKSEEALFNRHFLPKWLWKLLNRFRIGNEKYLSECSELNDELLSKFIKEEREKEPFHKEHVKDHMLLTGFINEYKDEKDQFIKDTFFSLMAAGRDTTSAALTWFFYLLANNHEVIGKIRKEIRAQLDIKDGEKWKCFEAKKLEKLVYLQGDLYEALRLFPPLPANQKLSSEADVLPSGH